MYCIRYSRYMYGTTCTCSGTQSDEAATRGGQRSGTVFLSVFSLSNPRPPVPLPCRELAGLLAILLTGEDWSPCFWASHTIDCSESINSPSHTVRSCVVSLQLLRSDLPATGMGGEASGWLESGISAECAEAIHKAKKEIRSELKPASWSRRGYWRPGAPAPVPLQMPPGSSSSVAAPFEVLARACSLHLPLSCQLPGRSSSLVAPAGRGAFACLLLAASARWAPEQEVVWSEQERRRCRGSWTIWSASTAAM
eukprot:COSAG02_NODE_27_length_51735_cov_86.076749_20_plen_253_part_00